MHSKWILHKMNALINAKILEHEPKQAIRGSPIVSLEFKPIPNIFRPHLNQLAATT